MASDDMKSACALGAAIEKGTADPVALTERFLDRIASEDPDHVVYLRTTPKRARAEAAAARERARAGLRRSPLDGVPLSWKDIYDSAGVATEMGTPLLAGRVPSHDATVLARASAAGLICLGKTNTVQFALGGIGTNPHTGTPANAVMTDVPRAPGGSSSGAAVSTARGLAAAGIGSDTGGSVRIPAAWNRLVGLKTSVGVLPTDGVLPLSPSLDTVGPLTRTVADAAHLFAIMAARKPVPLAPASMVGRRFLACESLVWDQADKQVADSVRQAIDHLAAAGASVDWRPVPEFLEIDDILNERGGTVTAEGYTVWRDFIDQQPDRIDPNVLARFLQGRDMRATDALAVSAAAARLTKSLYARMAGYDAILAPTTPILPPPITVADDPDKYSPANALALRNTRLGNVLPCCAATVPCPDPATPTGVMAMAPLGADHRILRIAAAIEAAYT